MDTPASSTSVADWSRIVEGTDAPPTLRASNLVSPLIMVFRRDDLFRALPAVGRDNRQHEHYLNEVLPILLDKGERVSVAPVDTGGVFGVNSRAGLAAVEQVIRGRINAAHLANGVTIIDPDATYIDVDVRIGRDTVIQPMTFLQGDTKIGSACSVGPSTRIVDSRVGDRSEVTFAVVLGSTIGRDVRVGPYARMRPGTSSPTARRSDRSSISRTPTVGKGSKVPHLSYVGDTDIGTDVNVGAGTVTVNFDGYRKHRTVIGDGAQHRLRYDVGRAGHGGADANTGAGSVITQDVPAGALAVERTSRRTSRGTASARTRSIARARARAEGSAWRSSRRNG